MPVVLSNNVWATRKKLDGRCDYRKSWENLSKRSLSLDEYGREQGVTLRHLYRPNSSAVGSWQAEIAHDRVRDFSREKRLSYRMVAGVC